MGSLLFIPSDFLSFSCFCFLLLSVAFFPFILLTSNFFCFPLLCWFIFLSLGRFRAYYIVGMDNVHKMVIICISTLESGEFPTRLYLQLSGFSEKGMERKGDGRRVMERAKSPH